MERTLSAKRSVLLTNDDGITGDGLRALEEALSAVADVYVLAPAADCSAVSSCLTMNRPVRLTAFSPRRCALDANPVDCVITALRSDLFAGVCFDAVFSGINRGPNLGTDIVYSGTVAAARQAALYGLPAVALSLDCRDGSWRYAALASFAARNLERLCALCDRRGESHTFVNVNAASADTYTDVVYSPLCRRNYRDRVAVVEAPDGRRYGFFLGGDIQSCGDSANDYDTVTGGAVAVSLLRAEPFAEPEPEHFSFLL